MGAHELHDTARAIVGRSQRHSRRRRVDRDDQEALRLDRCRVDGGEPPLLPAAPVRRVWDGGRDRRCHPLRRDDPPVCRRRHAVLRSCSRQRASCRVSRSTPAPTIRPDSLARRSRRGSTGFARGSRSTEGSARASRSGVPSSRSETASRPSHASARTRMPSRATPDCARRPGIVPIVEPEVLMDADNTIERCYDVTSRTLKWTFHELIVQGVDLRGALLKPNMVISGKGCPEQAPAPRIAELTDRVLHEPRSRGGSGDRVPLGWSVRGRGDGESERDQPDRRAVAALVLVRSRPAGIGSPSLERRRSRTPTPRRRCSCTVRG